VTDEHVQASVPEQTSTVSPELARVVANFAHYVKTEDDSAPKAPTSTPESEAPIQKEQIAPQGHGLVFVVARFAAQTGPLPHPPRIEYTASFQLATPADHGAFMAANLSNVVAPPAMPNPDDPLSSEPVQTPKFVCLCTGCGKN